MHVGSNKRVWWKCPLGHEFQGTINDRVGKNRGCPVCSNRLIIPGINDLKTLNPELAAEWDYWLNEIQPTEVGIHSNKKVWWICYKGHRWQTTVHYRSCGTNCPICAKKLKQKRKIEINGIMT